MKDNDEKLKRHGYTGVKDLEHAKDLLQNGFYVMMGGKEIMNTIASFHVNGKVIEVEVFDPSDMSMEGYKTNILGFEAAFASAIKNNMYIYAKPITPDTKFMSRKPKERKLIEIHTVEGVFEYLNANKSLVLSCDDVTFFITKVDNVVMLCSLDGGAKPFPINAFREMAGGIIERGGFFIFDPALHTTALKIEIRPEKEAGNETSS